MEYVFTESSVDALDRLQKSLRDLIESLEASRGNAEDLTVYAVPQRNPGEDAAVSGGLPENDGHGDSSPAGNRPRKEAPQTTLEEVRTVLIEKSREGKTALVKMLLERFNAESLPEVDPADYADLLEAGKAL